LIDGGVRGGKGVDVAKRMRQLYVVGISFFFGVETVYSALGSHGYPDEGTETAREAKEKPDVLA
jgi:hypothetical protein